MDEAAPKPLLFAHKVIQQFAEHLMGEGLVLELDEYMAIRLAFRKMGGSWEAVWQGNPEQLDLLKKVITSWGQNFIEKSEDEPQGMV